jgi:Flp pilus assembly protein TadD
MMDMPNESLLLLQQAAALLAAREFSQALQVTQQGLELDPANFDLLNIGAISAINADQADLAERLWLQALELYPDNPQINYNFGLLQANRKNFAQAEHHYRKALAVDGNNAEIHAHLGILLAQCNRDEEAELYYRQAFALDPSDGETYSNLGILLFKQGKESDAEQCYLRALTLRPQDARAWSNLGNLLAKRKQVADAEPCYRKAIELNPALAEAHTNLGLLLEYLQRYDEAEKCHRQAIALAPANAEAWSALGKLLTNVPQARQRAEEAERHFRKALEIDPHSVSTCSNFGVLLANQKRNAEAEQTFRKAIALDPAYSLAQLNLAFLLLSDGRLQEGWRLHEVRYDASLPHRDMPLPALPFPQWQGESLSGKSLLIYPEQGFGDAIQFCRYIPMLKQLGAARITLICRQQLKPLMETLEGLTTVIGLDEVPDPLPPHDYWTLLLSLPFHFKTELANIPAQLPYLNVPHERKAQWSARIPEQGFRIGLVWKGNAYHSNDANRSLQSLSVLAPLWSVPDVHFISLQKGAGEEEASHPPESQPLIHLGAELHDFADTAAIIDLFDLLICVDTAAAHLAGALGKPCWVLLPHEKTDWRWMDARNDSPWYPGAMRLFRQGEDEDWTRMIEEIRQELMRLPAYQKKRTA